MVDVTATVNAAEYAALEAATQDKYETSIDAQITVDLKRQALDIRETAVNVKWNALGIDAQESLLA
jgi:hypothetical protein